MKVICLSVRALSLISLLRIFCSIHVFCQKFTSARNLGPLRWTLREMDKKHQDIYRQASSQSLSIKFSTYKRYTYPYPCHIGWQNNSLSYDLGYQFHPCSLTKPPGLPRYSILLQHFSQPCVSFPSHGHLRTNLQLVARTWEGQKRWEISSLIVLFNEHVERFLGSFKNHTSWFCFAQLKGESWIF